MPLSLTLHVAPVSLTRHLRRARLITSLAFRRQLVLYDPAGVTADGNYESFASVEKMTLSVLVRR